MRLHSGDGAPPTAQLRLKTSREPPIGGEFRELLRHAREMHTLMVEQLDGGTEYARALADSIGTHLDELEAALKRDLN